MVVCLKGKIFGIVILKFGQFFVGCVKLKITTLFNKIDMFVATRTLPLDHHDEHTNSEMLYYLTDIFKNRNIGPRSCPSLPTV
jgi:hypothetical protein